MESLSAELVRDILLRVSAASLTASARHVCRSWRALIDLDPSFARDQLPFSTPGYLMRHFKPSTDEEAQPSASLFTYIPPSSSGSNEQFTMAESTGRLSRSYCIMQSYHGLLLTTSGEDHLPAYLCNPLLGEWIPLPPLVPEPEISPCRLLFNKVYCGFGFDASTDQYKVFSTRYRIKNVGECDLVCDVCTVGGQGTPTGWRRLPWAYGTFPADRRLDRPTPYPTILVDGRLHWVGHRAILSLDVGTESFAELQGPPHVDHNFFDCVLSLEGCLALQVSDLDTMRVEMWVMEEYGNVESWTKKYITGWERRSSIDPWVGGSVFYQDHLKHDGSSVSLAYAPHDWTEDQEGLDIVKIDGFTHREMLPYSPSLISLRRRRERKEEC